MTDKAKDRLFLEDLPEDVPATALERNIMRYVQIRGLLMDENLGSEIRRRLEKECVTLEATLSKEQIDVVAVLEEVSRELERWLNSN